MIILTRHFKERWLERVGNEADVRAVTDIIRDSITIQKGILITSQDVKYNNTLTLYWHPGLDLILSFDPFSNTMVSVLSKMNKKKYGNDRKKGNSKDKVIRQNIKTMDDHYISLTMHGGSDHENNQYR